MLEFFWAFFTMISYLCVLGMSHNHTRSGSGRYPVSPENGDMNEDHGVRRTRTPDVSVSVCEVGVV